MRIEREFKLNEFFPIMFEGSKSLVFLRSKLVAHWIKKHKMLSKDLKRRIMLSISGVNGCVMCSWVHTKKALSSGMEVSDIKNVLSGQYDHVPNDQLIAILYAEHYAETKEKPSLESLNRLVTEYGKDKAMCIQSICNVITMTTTLGITFAGFRNRLLFKKSYNKFYRELTMLLSMISIFPILYLYHWILQLSNLQKK